MTERVVFLGLDAADPQLIRRWAAAGELPAMARLLRGGAWARVANPPGFYVGAVWPSFYTALSPARHGRYCYSQFDPATYADVRFDAAAVQGEPFWEALDRAGRRVVVIDVPKSRLSPALRGTHVVDWGTHDPDRQGLRAAPSALAHELVQRYGGDPVGNCNRAKPTAAGMRDFRDRLLLRIGRKEAMVRHFLEHHEWDLLAACFSEAHCVGHQCWFLHDPLHERHDARLAAELGDPMLDVYRALDAAVGRLLSRLRPETRAFVLASHGMGPHHDGSHLLDEAVRRIDAALTPRRGPSLLRRWLPKGAARLLPARPERSFRHAFAVPNNEAFAGIRLNLVGREPRGRLAPEALGAYGDALMGELMALTKRPGTPAFLGVWRTADRYSGELLGRLPDVVAEWNRDGPFDSLASPTVGRLEGRYAGVRTGDHRAEGLLMATGAAGELPSVSVSDLAPTLCALQGVTLEGVDGRPIDALAGGATLTAAAEG